MMVDLSLIVDMVLGSLRAILLSLAGWPVILRTSEKMGGRGPVEEGIETYDAGSESTEKACLGRILRSLGRDTTLYKYLIREPCQPAPVIENRLQNLVLFMLVIVICLYLH
jgi:hypothetical protein